MISLHVIDVVRAVPAAGLAVELYSLDGARSLLAAGTLDENGGFSVGGEAGADRPGLYEALLRIGDYYRGEGFELPTPAFLEEVPFRFGIAEAGAHVHLPVKMSPWGFSLFKGA